ncbi:MAG: hypothetical protein Q7S36_03590 [Candidatus Liptonbacteria bacterium]|nr:hypothetical protein [Candidatus Liptonbacteria bacterium]
MSEKWKVAFARLAFVAILAALMGILAWGFAHYPTAASICGVSIVVLGLLGAGMGDSPNSNNCDSIDAAP